MMNEQQSDYLFELFKNLATKLNKNFAQMEVFYHILKDNWYDNEKALRQLTEQQWISLKIPARLATAIKNQIEAKSNSQIKLFKDSSLKQKRPIMNEHMMINYAEILDIELKNQYRNDSDAILQIYETLHKIIHNIIKDPYEMKFRILQKNKNKVEKVISLNRSVVRFLQLFGFQEDSQQYALHTPQIEELIFIEEVLEQKVKLLNKNKFSPFLENYELPPKGQQNFLNSKHSATISLTLEDQFSKQKLAEMKYVDALDKLLQFRQQILSKPPKDRKLRIYHKKYETRHSQNASELYIQDVVEKSEDKIIQSYWAQIISENKKNSLFQSKRKQEFQFLMKQTLHQETVIKVRLPNQFIIEARFASLQKLKNVFNFVSSVIIGDIYLFHAPPVKKLDKDMEKTLFELQSVPMGSFYLGINGDWYIVNEYSKIIQK